MSFPCIHAVWAQWAPAQERSLMAASAFSGMYLGAMLGMTVCGFTAATLGWPSVFYITGGVGLLWYVVWLVVVKDYPQDDPYISSEELKYIKQSVGNNNTEAKKVKHPWNKFLTSMPVWAIIVAHTCENWGFYTLLTQLPMFLKDIFNFQLAKAGFMSSLPYLAVAITVPFGAALADCLKKRNVLSTTRALKLFTSGAFCCQTVCMSLAGHMTTENNVVACLVLAISFEGISWSAFSVNHLEIAPQHASVLMGITNTAASLPGIISPLVTGYIVTSGTVEQWRIVLYISSSIYMFGAVFYWLFASGERQPWAMEDQTMSKNSELHTI
uniref:Major facilitator superfamily (MFS) profile domain-containing protein n=1 Tax=Graphocephala atropunctata TaxID=36148 RepID=A0A1B6MM37_9HEMI